MTFKESIPVAKQLAENQLSRGFDVEAFLVLCAISNMPTVSEDFVPESNIDEGIQHLLNCFVDYYTNRNEDTLKTMLDNLKQIISELYHTCISESEIEEFKTFIESLNNIYK